MTRRVGAPKRFFKTAGFQKTIGGFVIVLDDKPIKTPGRHPLIVPTRKLATLIAGEWHGQKAKVDPKTMPLTRLANTAIDRTAFHRDFVLNEIVAYAGHDLLCYRAEEPTALIKREAAAWDPYLVWVAKAFSIKLITTAGITHVEQSKNSVLRLKKILASASPFLLTALHNAATLSGSVVLALALVEGWKRPKDIWKAAMVDEEHQAKTWGRVEEAEVLRAEKADLWRGIAAFIGALDEVPSSGLRAK